jgi:hypothetical protein
MLYLSGAVAQIWIGSSIEAERPHVGVEARSCHRLPGAGRGPPT